ncbi:uncharacterized protein C8A04DRAFT_33805 [Dichotomopilus funicola]|uniref:Oxidoreductase AflY n=1 Tax=Dichotomopilus funicola TaxID=1934379 RepID=A0AAN6ZQZ2_9PEZI|nr:hypothetical protein C8A04DRAFT_33805 [Dichotomopilus funicola]
MATNTPSDAATTVHLSPRTSPGYTHVAGLTDECAKKTSELLTVNHKLYHTRWNLTFHNHIAHHLLAIWALGGSPAEIQDMWDYNAPYQGAIERPRAADSPEPDLKDPVQFEKCLGVDDCYLDFLRFFEGEIAEKGVPAVIHEYLLKGDERADDIFGRMYTDLVHPIIHLGSALEFDQPGLVAEALAGACVHFSWPKTFLLPTEEHVRSNPGEQSTPFLQLLDGMRHDPVIASGVRDGDPFNKIPDAFLKRVTPAQLVPHLSRFRVKAEPEDLRRKTTEMLYASAYVLGAAQRPGKREKMDFVTLHSATLAVFYPALLALDWLSDAEKARMLEAKVRVDAVMYAGCACPALYPERIIDYVPQHPADGWPELIHRAIVYRDEGHAAKLIRALYCVEQLDEPVPENFPIGKEHLIKIAHMAMDSIEASLEPDGHNTPDHVAKAVLDRVGHGGEMVLNNTIRWVFYGGLEKAWLYVPEKKIPV